MESYQEVLLATLANGILPADARDDGAAEVQAGRRLEEKLNAGINQALYDAGLDAAEALSRKTFGRDIPLLDATQMHELLGMLREEQPAFFRQLRMDVCALYLTDPGVWARIGFPGPSTAQGGYPDFDQPQ
jgi:hypothetical protein